MDTNLQQQDNPSKNPFVLVAVVGLIALIGYLFFNSTQNNNATSTAENTSETSVEPALEAVNQVEIGDNVREFTVKGSDYAFDLKEIKVKQGDTVRINFVNDGGFHDWKLDEFNAATQKLQVGGTETIEFVADKTGTFEYYCSVGKHRELGMVGNLIVE